MVRETSSLKGRATGKKTDPEYLVMVHWRSDYGAIIDLLDIFKKGFIELCLTGKSKQILTQIAYFLNNSCSRASTHEYSVYNKLEATP